MWNVNDGTLFTGENQNVVLIETLWNVNRKWIIERFTRSFVLIETLWNVNDNWHAPDVLPLYVLIETLWNVNMTPFVYIGDVSRGINRNIVECKYGMDIF